MRLLPAQPRRARGHFRFSSATALLSAALASCASARTTRVVDASQGSTLTYGAPRDVSYSFEVEPELDVLRLHLYRSARCDVIPVELVQRRTETLRGDHVVSSVDQGLVQIAKAKTGEVTCDTGYANDVEVSLIVGNAVHRLGTADAYGYVALNLGSELREKLFGASVPGEATVRLRPPKARPARDIGKISLASLRDYENGVTRLLDQLNALLAKDPATLSSADIQQSYDSYERLRALAWHDPRFKAASARFWELFFARKQLESAQNLQRNLKALESARGLLKEAGVAAIPLFMQVAVSSASFDPRAVDWASGELLGALRQRPQLCASFDWTKLSGYGFLPPTELAVHYLRFVYGDAFYNPISGRCSFITRG
jgi:hypothetical protein